MTSEEVKLIGFWVSPFSIRVEWALILKGVEYEYIEEDVFNKSPLLLELNPVHKKVPVFIHNEKVVLESFVILEYIDEIWKENPLLPQDPYQRAMVRFWAKFAEEKLLESAFYAMRTLEDEELKAEKITVAMEALEKIEGELKGKSFFGGESIGYLDLALGWVSYWLPIWEEAGSMKIIDPLKFPAIISWMNRFTNHTVIKNKLPPREKTLLDSAFLALCSLEDEKVKAEKITVAMEALEKIEGELKGKSFFGGESIGYLDLALGWISYWLPVCDEVGSMKILDPLKFPAITSWVNRFTNHQLIKSKLPPRDKTVVYFQEQVTTKV